MELPEGSDVLQTTEIEPVLNQADAVDQTAASCDEAVTDNLSVQPVTKADIIIRLEELAERDPAEVSPDDIARCKQQFYSLHNEEIRTLRSEFIEAGNNGDDFTLPADETEERMKELLTLIKERKARLREEQEAARQANYERKLAIIGEIAELCTDTDNINRHHVRAKELQAEFKAAGDVPPQYETTVWKQYQEVVERFYDHSKINKELYDYDLKKNLGEKQLLLDEANGLTSEADVITAFRRLQELHTKWREIGPVPREQRETIWNEFKDASAIINKRYQDYFEKRKAVEKENEDAKTALCERVEAVDFATMSTFSDWDETTKIFLEAQEAWKKLGYASKKVNNALFSRFRAACDKFFKAKADFYRSVKQERAERIAAKTALVEEAEALMSSTDWKVTSDKMIDLQKRWKEISGVGRQQTEALWKRFQTACDYFFEQKKKVNGEVRNTEMANLRAKKDLIARLKALDTEDSELSVEEISTQVKAAQAEWKEIGHVPFRDKTKLYEQFRAAIDALYEHFDLRGQHNRMVRFESNIASLSADQAKLMRERDKLMRAYEARKNDLHTYENNLGFLSSKSKSGDSMVREIERRVERLKADLAELSDKIKLLDSKL